MCLLCYQWETKKDCDSDYRRRPLDAATAGPMQTGEKRLRPFWNYILHCDVYINEVQKKVGKGFPFPTFVLRLSTLAFHFLYDWHRFHGCVIAVSRRSTCWRNIVFGTFQKQGKASWQQIVSQKPHCILITVSLITEVTDGRISLRAIILSPIQLCND
jgi:hypothetical protein